MRSFDHFAVIDWSGAKGPRQKGLAVAICAAGDDVPQLVHPQRRWSRADVLDWLISEMPDGTLVGLDLSPGLPFEDHGAFFPEWKRSPRDAKALWALVDEIAADDPHLSVGSFVCHPDVRRHFRHGQDDCGDLFERGAGRLRRTERQQKAHKLAPSSCFNLVGAAQVGKSSLTGMRVLHRLTGQIPVWPFDDLPTTGSAIVEIYTSLAAREAGIPAGRAKMYDRKSLQLALSALGLAEHMPLTHYTDHATDAILTAAWLRQAAARSELWSPEGMESVRHTEGWTFGVK